MAIDTDEYGVEVIPEDERWIKRSGGSLIGGSLVLAIFAGIVLLISYFQKISIFDLDKLLVPAAFSSVFAIILTVFVLKYASRNISRIQQYNKYKERYKPVFDELAIHPRRVVLENNLAKAQFSDLPGAIFMYYFGIIRSEERVTGGTRHYIVNTGYAVSSRMKIKERWKGEIIYCADKEFGQRFICRGGKELEKVFNRLRQDDELDRVLESLSLLPSSIPSAVRFDYGIIEIDLYLKSSVTPRTVAEATEVIKTIYCLLSGRPIKPKGEARKYKK